MCGLLVVCISKYLPVAQATEPMPSFVGMSWSMATPGGSIFGSPASGSGLGMLLNAGLEGGWRRPWEEECAQGRL